MNKTMGGLFDDRTGNRAFIDLLRSIGILQVVLFHVIHGIVRFAPESSIPGFVDRLPFVLNFAWQAYGVDIIFVVSAFLLTCSLLHEHKETGDIDIRRYYIRRLSRILPLYYIALIGFAVIQGDTLFSIVTSALFIGYTFGDYNVIPVGWSMEVLILYYLALPWVLRVLLHSGRPVTWLALTLLGVALWRLMFLLAQPEDPAQLFLTMLDTKQASPAGFELYFRPWFRLPAFVMGTLIAFLLVQDRVEATPRTPLMTLGLMALIIWLPVQDAGSWAYQLLSSNMWAAYWALSPVLFAWAFAFFVLWGLLRGREKPWHIARPLRGFSTNIFAVYLFHMPFLAVGAIVVFRTTNLEALADATAFHVVAVFVVTAGLTYLFAWPVTRFIERPLQNWIRKRAQ